jgi:hypothetical protein
MMKTPVKPTKYATKLVAVQSIFAGLANPKKFISCNQASKQAKVVIKETKGSKGNRPSSTANQS